MPHPPPDRPPTPPEGDAARPEAVVRPEAVGGPAARVAVATGVSRVGGLVRESLFAALFGSTHRADAFQIAFRIPNLLRDLFAEGALSSAFVPTFAKTARERGAAAAFETARRVLGTLLVVTGALAALGILFAGPVVAVVAAEASAGKRAEAEPLVRIMAPFLPVVAAAAVLMGVLNARRRYLAPAYAPVLFNGVAIVGGLALLALRLPIEHALVGWSVLVVAGGLAQALVQWPFARREGLRGPLLFDLRFRDPDLRAILARMGPTAVALAGTQVMLVVSTALASGEEGWVSSLTYAFRLIHLPIGLVGVALGTVSLAAASRRAAEGDAAGLADVVRRALRLNLFLTLPAAAGLAALAEPIVRVVYERGAFDAAATETTAGAVRTYALGIFAYAGLRPAAAAFHARGDTRTPMRASLLGIGANLVCTLAGRPWLGLHAFALATALGATVNYAWLRFAAGRVEGGVAGAGAGLAFAARVVVATAVLLLLVGGAGATLLARGGPADRGLLVMAVSLGLTCVAGAFVYVGVAHVLKIGEASGIVRRMRRRRPFGDPSAPS